MTFEEFKQEIKDDVEYYLAKLTPKEIAEEYVRNHIYYEVAKRENGAEYVKEAFLAGFKAGKDINVPIKWHDLRKNPDDLPPIEGCCSIDVLADSGRLAYYHYDNNCWVDTNGVDEIDPPKAWCEIPK